MEVWGPFCDRSQPTDSRTAHFSPKTKMTCIAYRPNPYPTGGYPVVQKWAVESTTKMTPGRWLPLSPSFLTPFPLLWP